MMRQFPCGWHGNIWNMHSHLPNKLSLELFSLSPLIQVVDSHHAYHNTGQLWTYTNKSNR